MACVTLVTFHLHMNGQKQGGFEGGKGLRQGDPLSPLLFVLSMEYLSRLLKKAATSSAFKFHPHYKALNLCHLMFADDLFVFCKADPSSLELLIQVMHSFTQVFGLKANISKSSIVIG